MNDVLATGRVLGGRYRLVEEVARGGMARVWVAEDPILRRRVAVKILEPTLADDENVRQRFRHEAIAAARLTHPGIVATYDTGEDDGVAYIVMELVDGSTLRALIVRRRTLPVGEAAEIGAQVADALEHAHARGLVHRDVKPGNVLVEADGRVKVTDFGIAKAAGTGELTRAGSIIGTARYLAPEQVEGGPVDARTDVYALGLVLYEMLCGKTPFDGDNEIANAVARLRVDPVPVGDLRPDVPHAVQDVVTRALSRDPAGRPRSVAEIRDALTPFRRDTLPDLSASASFDMTGIAPVADTQDRKDHGSTAGQDAQEYAQEYAPDHAFSSAPHGGHRTARVIVLGLLAVVGVVVLLVAFAGRGGRSAGNAGPSSSARTAVPAVPLRITDATDFDPLGDTGQEHRPEVGRVMDGRADTAWRTEGYRTPDLGGKAGVGVVLRLAGRANVRTVRVQALEAGWSGSVYVLDSAPQSAPTGPSDAAGQNLPRDAAITLPTAKPGRFVLVWITRLPPDGPPFRLEIAEVGLAS